MAERNDFHFVYFALTFTSKLRIDHCDLFCQHVLLCVVMMRRLLVVAMSGLVCRPMRQLRPASMFIVVRVVLWAHSFITMPRRKVNGLALNGDSGESVPRKNNKAKQAPHTSVALVASGFPIDQQLQQQQQQQDTSDLNNDVGHAVPNETIRANRALRASTALGVPGISIDQQLQHQQQPQQQHIMPVSNNDSKQTVPNKKCRTKRAVCHSSILATTGVPTDEQVQQQQIQQDSQQAQLQQQIESQEARQLHSKDPAGVTRPKAEEVVLSEASTLVIAASSSPSRSTSPDIERAVTDPVVVSTTASTAAAPSPPKRQRVRNHGTKAYRTRMSLTVPNSDLHGQLTNTFAFTAPVVQHATVSAKTGRAKPTVARCPRQFQKDIFFKRASDAQEAFLQDLANRAFHYPFPFIGNITCEFIGKTNGENYHEIIITDDVAFRWYYTCIPKPCIQINGFSDSHQSVRSIVYGTLPPRTTRVMLTAIIVAKLYEKLSPEMCPFVRKYCQRKGLAAGACEILCIGFPKPLVQMSPIEDFIDMAGTSAKWIRCASIGETGKSVCHPGASARYSTNRMMYNVNELRVFDTADRKEAAPESHKLRKRIASKTNDKLFPESLADANSGSDRGFRDVIAYAYALAEFELAEHQKRDVSVGTAMKGFELDPFAWDDSADSNMVVVMWRSAGGKHHLQKGSLRYLLRFTNKSSMKQDSEEANRVNGAV